MDIQFAKYMILVVMMCIGAVPVFMKYLETPKEGYEKDYSGAKEWMFCWWFIPVVVMVRFVLNN